MQSAFLEYIIVKCSWSSIYREIGDYVTLDFKISGIIERGNTIGQIREKSVDSKTGFVTFKILSFRNFSINSYTSPTYSSDLSEQNATIGNE